mmetsp:Transcript_92409/g.198096  ORF Transcript_92409/g.198096 Transcript_92409/m.198096 type:complete len:196 (+) Transcript_92409:139-726(+)
MFFPFGAIFGGMGGMGSPTPAVLRMKKWMIGMLVVQAVLDIMRFVVLTDIMGGFIMLIVVAFGAYAVYDDMNLQIIFGWGFMGLFNGAFDLVRIIDRRVNAGSPLFVHCPKHHCFSKDYEHAVARYNFESAIMLLCPISLVLGALMAYVIYKRSFQTDDVESQFVSDTPDQPPPRSRQQPPSYQSFGGQGHRLGR